MAYKTMYLGAVEYPSSSCTFTKNQTDKIHRPATRAIIGALGVNRSFPRVIAFAPRSLMGLDMNHMYTSQGIQHIIMILAHVRQNSENGKMYIMSLEMAQLLTGVTKPLFEYPGPIYKHVNDPYLDFMRPFLAKHSLSISIPGLWTPTLQRHLDKNLMEVILENTNSPKELRQVNQCRLYLQVIRLSDISNGKGDEILRQAFYQSFKTNSPTSNLTWPRQELPPATSWKTWRRLLRRCFLIDRTGQLRSYRLVRPMGRWLPTGDTTWKYYYSPSTNMIYDRRIESLYYGYSKTARRGCLFSDDDETAYLLTEIPDDSFPVTSGDSTPRGREYSIYRPSILTLQRNLVTQTPPRTTPYVLSTRGTIQKEHLSEWERPLLRKVQRMVTAASLRAQLAALSHRSLRLGISVGPLGTDMCFSWSLFLGAQHIWTGSGTMPQGIGPQTTNICHLAAVYAGCYVARTMSNSDWTQSAPCIQIITGNDSSHYQLHRVRETPYYSPRRTLRQEYEWQANLIALLAARRFRTYSFQLLDPDSKSQAEQLRSQAYNAASDALTEYRQLDEALNTPELSVCDRGKAYILHEQRIITRDYAHHIRLAVHTPQHQAYLNKKHSWTDEEYNSINWEAQGKSFKPRSLTSQLRLTKYAYGWLPIGEKMTKIDPTASSLCPSCNQVEETTDHIMCCSAASRQDLRMSQLDALHEKLVELRTPNTLEQVMQTALAGWAQDNDYHHPTVPTRTPTDRLLNIAIRAQNKIGWGQLYRGRLAQEFQSFVTHVHFGRPVNLYVSHAWSIALISWLWDTVESQWKLRNESLHGTDIEDTRSKIRGRLTEAVRRIYSYKSQLTINDQRILQRPIDTILAMTTASIEIWINTVKPTISQCLSEDALDPNENENYLETMQSPAATD